MPSISIIEARLSPWDARPHSAFQNSRLNLRIVYYKCHTVGEGDLSLGARPGLKTRATARSPGALIGIRPAAIGTSPGAGQNSWGGIENPRRSERFRPFL